MVCGSAENNKEHEDKGACDQDEGHSAHGTAYSDVSRLPYREQLGEIEGCLRMPPPAIMILLVIIEERVGCAKEGGYL